MRLTALLVFSVVIASEAQNAGISTKVLTPGAPMRVQLSPALTTTLLFPSPLSGTFGLGLVTANANSGGSVQVDHPEGSNILVLHALSETAHVVATVLLDGQLYVFDLQSGPDPDVALTLVKSDPAAPRAAEVTPQEVVEQRPKYDPELLIGFERKAHDAPVMRKLYPALYEGYASRQGDYTSDSGTVKTTVSSIHRFSKEDAVVLEGTVENETTHPIEFDGRATTVQVSNEVHPAKLTDCIRPIPAGATVPIVVVLQGDVDGGRANLSIQNEFRIMLPGDAGTVWQWKNGSHSGKPFKIAPPVPNAPLTQATPKETP
ncbi:MAG: hypothetical protein JO279_18325 [Verrucomicrobia bacterium]|nr:hypothetical protein [Verrucomicrobiota bacterium]